MEILPDDAPAPRLCHLIKWPDFDGYGFNLHAERSNPGQYIGKIDEDSPAQLAGLREGDRIVEVNGVNISNENHRQVVERIKSNLMETKLLVVDAETDLWYKEQDLIIKSSQPNVVYSKTPVPRAAKLQVSDLSPQGASLSPSTNGSSSLVTSDFNDDSIEQAPSVAVGAKQRVSPPPMSPDSGRGDEEPALLTVEAEINRQSPQRQMLDSSEEVIVSKIAANNNNEEEEEQTRMKMNGAGDERQENGNEPAREESCRLEPDSLSSSGASVSAPAECAPTRQVSNSNLEHSFATSPQEVCCGFK